MTRPFHPRSTLVALALLAGLTACGSSSASPGTGTTPRHTSTGSSPTTSAPTSTPSPTGTHGVDDTYLPVAEGNTWTYRVNYGSSALGVVTDTERMLAVHQVADGTRVTISRHFHYRSGRVQDFNSKVDYVFHPDGSLTVPFQNGTQARGTRITVKSGSVVWPTPQNLAKGTPSKGHLKVSITVAGRPTINADVLVTLRGAGTAAVKVPAGSFPHARVLDETVTERLGGLGTKVTVKVHAYLVPGVGMVETTVGSGASGLISTELLSFHKG